MTNISQLEMAAFTNTARFTSNKYSNKNQAACRADAIYTQRKTSAQSFHSHDTLKLVHKAQIYTMLLTFSFSLYILLFRVEHSSDYLIGTTNTQARNFIYRLSVQHRNRNFQLPPLLTASQPTCWCTYTIGW